jgi:hypothetical protein
LRLAQVDHHTRTEPLTFWRRCFGCSFIYRTHPVVAVRRTIGDAEGVTSMRVWPFVGRDGELSLIGSAFAGSDLDAVILTGPAGAGKTRLAAQALSDLAGARSAWVSATQAAAGIPFAAVAPLLPEDAAAGGPLGLMHAAAAQVRGWGGRRQVAIGVDDAHLLDDASSTLVAHLVTSRAAFVVMTVRSGELMADVLARLCKDGHAEVVEVPPLPQQVMDTLIDKAAPG